MCSLSLGSGKEVTVVEKERESPEIKSNLDRDICSEELRNEVLYQNKLGEVILREDQYINRNGLICEKNKENEERRIHRELSELRVRDYVNGLNRINSIGVYSREDYERRLEQKRQERQRAILNSTPRELSLRINEREHEMYFYTKDMERNEHAVNRNLEHNRNLLQEKYEPSKYTKEQQERIERDETLQRPSEYVYRTMSLSELKQLFDGREVARCEYMWLYQVCDKFCFFPKTPVYEDRSNEYFSKNHDVDKDTEIKLHITFRIINKDFYENLTYSRLSYRGEKDPCFDKIEDDRTLFAREFHIEKYSLRELCPVRINDKDVENVKVRDILNYFENRCGEPIFKIPNEVVGKGIAANNLFYNVNNSFVIKKDYYFKREDERYY